MLAELNTKRASPTSTLRRIEGAVHVLQEMSGERPGNSASPKSAPPKMIASTTQMA
jgi:hypothetical protein